LRAYGVLAAYALLALILVPVFPHFVSPSETARWLSDAALVENHTFEVTPLLPIIGGAMEDLAIVNGHAYSNKAPGTSLLTLPGYLLGRAIAGPPSAGSMRTQIDLMRITGATLPLLALGLLFIHLGRRWSSERTTFVLWLLLFATPLFAYGFLLFSHAFVTAALFAAWVLLFVKPNDWLAGALIGLAVACEYPVAIAGLVLLGGVAATRDWRRVARVIIAGAPFAIALAIYHRVNFGSVWTTPYSFGRNARYREMVSGGFFGIHLPSPLRLLQILLDPGVGLLVFAPFLILAIPAFRSARRELAPAAWWTLLLVPASLLLLYAGYEGWAGGWNVGPRYLMPVVPFLIAPMLFRCDGIAEPLLAGFAACAVTLATLVFPFPPREFPFPWMSLDVPLLAQGLVAPNLFHLIARPMAIAVPFAIVLAAAALAMKREALYAVIGVLLAIVIGSQAGRLSPPPLMNLERAYIDSVYFERPGSPRYVFPPGLQRRALRERARPPAPWPF
jgi:hypothetical protein